jgi:hypothetical protein
MILIGYIVSGCDCYKNETCTSIGAKFKQCVVKRGVIKGCRVLDSSGIKKKGVGQSLNGDGILKLLSCLLGVLRLYLCFGCNLWSF